MAHTPVKEIDGEDPIKANGKMLVIDGGFSKAYQSTTILRIISTSSRK
jgi:fructose-1,6-bisphosphatase-3